MSKLVPSQYINAFLKQWLKDISGKKQIKSYLKKNFDKSLQVNVVAIGKASVSMANGLIDFFEKPPKQLLCISKINHLDKEFKVHLGNNKTWQYIESSHPIVDQKSIDAGNRLCDFLSKAENSQPLIFLISGGASALVEKLPKRITLKFIQDLNKELIASGKNINEINTIRKKYSLIKSGGLVSFIQNKQVDVLYISDVPDNNPAIIGSGLLKAENDQINHHIIFDNQKALALAVKLLKGHKVYHHQTLIFDDIFQTQKIITQVVENNPDFDIFLFGGETTIKLPKNSGKGGRNQHLALLFAKHFIGVEPLFGVVLGTDGTDGDTELAGAWFSNDTAQKMAQIDECLKKANSYELVKKLGLGIKTGATGTNVMDVIMIFKGTHFLDDSPKP